MREPIQMNRHRGLAAGQLTRRYHRLRAAATWGIDLEEVELIAEEKRIEESPSDYDHYYDYLVCLDPIGGRSTDDFLLEEQQPEVLRTFCSWPRLDSQWPGEILTTAAWPEPPPPDPDNLPATLHAHATQLMGRLRSRTFSWAEHLASAWAFAGPAVSVAVEPRTSATVGADPAASALSQPRFPLCPGLLGVLRHFADCPGSAIMALLFAPFWVRPLSSFRLPDGSLDVQTSALIEHLFVRYPVPRCLLQEWEPARLGDEGALPSLKWVYWLLLLGQGASLQRAAQWFGWRIPARFVHHFVSAPPALQPAEACLWAEVARRGGQPIDFRRLTRWAAYLLDPTDAGGCLRELPLQFGSAWWQVGLPPHAEAELVAQEAEPASDHGDRRRARALRFWNETIDWLIKHREQLTDEHSTVILAWATQQFIADRADPEQQGLGFTLRGRQPQATYATAREYRPRGDKPQPVLFWSCLGMDWQFQDDKGTSWSCRELTSSHDLADESRVMGHCVASYAYLCGQGLSAIFSLRANGSPQLTIELEPASRAIVQVRGMANRLATAAERAILRRWLDTQRWPAASG